MVGAMSRREPAPLNRARRPWNSSGTVNVVCAVWFWPDTGSFISSMFP